VWDGVKLFNLRVPRASPVYAYPQYRAPAASPNIFNNLTPSHSRVRLSPRAYFVRMTDSDLVYSTSTGRMCSACGRSERECVCREMARTKKPATAGQVRVGRETAGRKGKGVTVVTGLPLSAARLEELGSTIKRRCGSGGTVRDGVIEVQGEHRDAIVAYLQSLGYAAKRSGG
jgi:translation initiation factor 1